MFFRWFIPQPNVPWKTQSTSPGAALFTVFKWSRPHLLFIAKLGNFCLLGARRRSVREPFENLNFITQKLCVVMSGNSAQHEHFYKAGLWLVFYKDANLTRKGATSKTGELFAAVKETVCTIFCIQLLDLALPVSLGRFPEIDNRISELGAMGGSFLCRFNW